MIWNIEKAGDLFLISLTFYTAIIIVITLFVFRPVSSETAENSAALIVIKANNFNVSSLIFAIRWIL